MTPIRVLLADDHELVRAGFRALLDSLSDVEVVAEADDGRAALKLVALHRPDVVLMDITMPGLNGLEATSRIARDFSHTRVIILSMHASEDHVLLALRQGASGYLLKGARRDELDQAVRTVSAGRMTAPAYRPPRAPRGGLVQGTQWFPCDSVPRTRLAQFAALWLPPTWSGSCSHRSPSC